MQYDYEPEEKRIIEFHIDLYEYTLSDKSKTYTLSIFEQKTGRQIFQFYDEKYEPRPNLKEIQIDVMRLMNIVYNKDLTLAEQKVKED